MTVRDEVDRAIDAYHGDDLQAVTVGFDLWDAFCREIEMEPKPVFDGLSDVEVVYRGMSIRPGVGRPDHADHRPVSFGRSVRGRVVTVA